MTVWDSPRGLGLGDAFGEQSFLLAASEVDGALAERRAASCEPVGPVEGLTP